MIIRYLACFGVPVPSEPLASLSGDIALQTLPLEIVLSKPIKFTRNSPPLITILAISSRGVFSHQHEG